MKLLQRTGLYFMGFSLVILLVGSVSIFYALEYLLDHEMDENLLDSRSVLYKKLNKKEEIPLSIEMMEEVFDIAEIPVKTNIEIFKDTILEVEEDDGEMEMETFRQYIYTETINDKNYRIALQHSKYDSEQLLAVISIIVVVSLLFFFILLNLFNRYISQKLWQPFYHTINQIRNFSLSKPANFSGLPTRIEEFNTLDNALNQMTEKLVKDFLSLKQFTENASHEIQTPLAIIQSQIELLLQNKHDEKTLQHLHQIQQSASKLSKLNKSLLLLTSIENRQFEPKEEIALDKVITQKLEALALLIASKSIKVHTDLDEISVFSNPVLTDVMISNLLTNAIRHNILKGKINIQLRTGQLVVRNTGAPLSKPPAELFERFQKSNEASKSIGLGLAIVKEICEVYSWTIEYKNADDWHEIIVKFNL